MKRLALAVAFLIALAMPAWADFQAVKAAYFSGDYATAFREFEPLAEQGVALAQFSLGFMYEKGQGVPQDYAEAVKWYRKAAEQGHGEAMNNLSLMYSHGRGVPQDYVRAHMWFNLAASRLPPGKVRDDAVFNRDSLARLMTPEQIAEAQRLAREWKRKR